jgi:iron(III) transport system ATP-binding protein
LTKYFENPQSESAPKTQPVGRIPALDEFSLDVWEGTVVTLLGPSGCGKTPALRVIAGFESAQGRVEIRGRTVLDESVFIPPEKRRVGMVFQDYALFPHMTVERNISYGLAKGDSRKRIAEVIELVGLHGLESRMPHELSGGQQQRVALARALAPEPDVILLDEPFSNLDAALRERVRRELRVILTEARTTAVFVTHDQEEALASSDIVAVMRDGRVLQADTPAHLYTNPVDSWVATFLGDADIIGARANDGHVDTVIGRFQTDLTGEVAVMVRPEDVQISLGETPNATVSHIEYFGHDQLITLAMAGGVRIRSRIGSRPTYQVGQTCRARAIDARVFPK